MRHQAAPAWKVGGAQLGAGRQGDVGLNSAERAHLKRTDWSFGNDALTAADAVHASANGRDSVVGGNSESGVFAAAFSVLGAPGRAAPSRDWAPRRALAGCSRPGLRR